MTLRSKWLLTLLLACSFTTPVSAVEWGDLKGRFVYDGTAPKPAPMTITKDIECCGPYQAEIVDQRLLVGETGGLQNVFVYLKASDEAQPEVHSDYVAAAAKPTKIDNLHCMFYPHGVGLWAGKQSLLVINSDPIGQAVKLDCTKNASINALMPVGGQVEAKFDVGETLPRMVSCGVHPWESAYLLIHSNPYFAVSDKEGNFVIKNIPAGEWTFQFWQEKAGYLVAKPEWEKGRVTLTIKAGENDLGEVKCSPDLFNKE